MHMKCDKSEQNVTKLMFCQKCGRRVKANSIRNVMKYDRIIHNVTKYVWNVIKSYKCDKIMIKTRQMRQNA